MNVVEHYHIVGSTSDSIVESVERGIRDGELKGDERLPPIRKLAKTLGVSPATVAAAYRRLRERGLVVGGGRRGTVVSPRPPLSRANVSPLRAGVRDLRIGVPDPALLPDVAAVLASVEVDRELVDGGGGAEPELLKAGAKRFRADGIDAGHMAVVGGALDGVERVLATHVGPGDLVAVEDPSYPPILDLLAAMGATLVPVAVDDEGMQPDSLREALARRPRAIVTVPRAQNPIGAVTSTERAEVLRGLLQREEGLLVVEDDHAHDIVDAPFHALSLGMERRATIRSVSKSLDPDLRLAVVAGDEVTISRLEGRQAVGTGWVSTILQRAVLSLWSDPATAALISRARATYRERREALRDALAERGIASHGQSGLNVWVPVRDEAAIVASLLDAGWAVRAGEHFRIRSGPGIRITTASLLPDEAVELASAIATSSHAALEARRMY